MSQLVTLIVSFPLWLLAFQDRALDQARATLQARRGEPEASQRGSVTIEQVLWAGAVIVIVGIVVAAITTYVKSEAGKIK